MTKIQPCRNGCSKLITVQFDDKIQKYVPYEVDMSGNPTGRHNCPNSAYNQQRQGTPQGSGSFNTTSTPHNLGTVNSTSTIPTTPPTNTYPIDKPSLEATLLNQVSQKVEQISANLNQFKIQQQETLTNLGELVLGIHESIKQNGMMLDALVAHFKLTEPKKASELYNEQQQQQQETDEEKAQRERDEINSWNKGLKKEES